MPGIADVKLGRLVFMTLVGPDSTKEQVGDPLNADGAIVGPGDPRGRAFAPKLPLRAAVSDPNSRTVAARMRRQIRALLENDIARLQGTYFSWAVDPELNGWLLLGAADIQAGPGGGITMADWELAISDAYLVGQLRTHRPARTLRSWDRRLSTTPRDLLGTVFSTDWANATAHALHFLPAGASDPLGSGNTIPGLFVRNTLEGAIAGVVDQPDSQIVSYEQAETNLNKADVVILDRQTFTAPTYTSAGDLAPQDTYGWEEVYGPDQPLTAGDVPVIQNGLCRVRYDATNTPGFRIDAYNPATSRYVEQGKVIFYRNNGGTGLLNTLVSAAVVEWTPERAVLRAVMRDNTDAASRENVYITLQRGWTGPRVEIYPSPPAGGGFIEAGIFYYVADADASDTVIRVVSGSIGKLLASGSYSTSGSDENWLAINRQGATHGAVLAFLQVGLTNFIGTATDAYGASRFRVRVRNGTGWKAVQFGYYPQAADQSLEAEAIRNTSSGTTSDVTDGAATGGHCVRDTQVFSAAATVIKNSSDLQLATYRIMALVRTNGGIGEFTAIFANGGSSVAGPIKTTDTAGSFAWVDLGELTPLATPTTFEISGWRDTATSVDIDRVELVKTEDRVSAAPTYDGARDLAQSVLYDARQTPELVARG